MSARTAPARRRPARAKTAKRRPAAKKSRRPQLDDRQIDLLGLGLVAAAVFFAFLIWLGWDGGRAGGWAVEGLRWLLGAVHYAVPVALMAAGRDRRPAPSSCPRCARSAPARCACSPG